jgi:hypothetical protein
MTKFFKLFISVCIIIYKEHGFTKIKVELATATIEVTLIKQTIYLNE